LTAATTGAGSTLPSTLAATAVPSADAAVSTTAESLVPLATARATASASGSADGAREAVEAVDAVTVLRPLKAARHSLAVDAVAVDAVPLVDAWAAEDVACFPDAAGSALSNASKATAFIGNLLPRA
jgi:hypothetical protein